MSDEDDVTTYLFDKLERALEDMRHQCHGDGSARATADHKILAVAEAVDSIAGILHRLKRDERGGRA